MPRKKDFDILLLDIEMGAMDGVTMARKLRQDNHTVQIIFITGYADYISDGYEVDAPSLSDEAHTRREAICSS